MAMKDSHVSHSHHIVHIIMGPKLFLTAFFVTCLAYYVYAQANCTAVGRFPFPNDATCKNYTYCVLNPVTNNFFAYNYVCPTTSVFNPATSQCTTNYNCTGTTAANTTNSVCTADGFVADPTSSNCSSYIQCVQSPNGTFSQTTLPCPPNTFYNPTTTFCDPTYNCTTTSTTFSCSSVGRFSDPAATACQSYYYCVLAANGTYVQYQYTCPTTSVFNPATQLCTTSYTCPT